MPQTRTADRLYRYGLFSLAAVQIYSLLFQQILAIAVIIIGILTGLSIFKGGSTSPVVRRICFAAMIFIFVRFVSGLYNPNMMDGLNELQFHLMALLFFSLVSWPSHMGEKEGKQLGTIWVWAAVIACTIGLVKYLAGLESRTGPPFGPHITHPDRLPEGNFATMAKFVAMTMLYFGSPVLIAKPIKAVRIKLGWLIALAIGLFLTFSRSCWLAVGAVFAALTYRRNRRLLTMLAIAGLLAVIIVPYARHRVVQSFAISDWSSGRIQVWRIAYDRILDRPFFGHGLGTFSIIVDPEIRADLPDSGVGDWHNQFLQIYMESGLIGLSAFGWFVFQLFKGFRWAFRSSLNEDVKRASLGGICLLSGALIFGLFEDFLGSPSANISFWMLVGFGVGWLRHEGERATS